MACAVVPPGAWLFGRSARPSPTTENLLTAAAEGRIAHQVGPQEPARVCALILLARKDIGVGRPCRSRAMPVSIRLGGKCRGGNDCCSHHGSKGDLAHVKSPRT